MKVVIFRGLPGSGKSTLAKTLGGFVVSADDYFTVNGIYNFDPSRLAEAHSECMRAFLRAFDWGHRLIIVDNTNTRLMEVSPYRLVALAKNYTVEIHRVVCDPVTAFHRGTHRVPLHTILAQQRGFESLPVYWGNEIRFDTNTV